MTRASSGSGTSHVESARTTTGSSGPATRRAVALKKSSGRSAEYTRVGVERFRMHGGTVARLRWWHVTPVAHHHRVHEMLVEVVDIFDQPVVHRAADAQEVDHRQVLHVLAQANTAGVRTRRHPELG